MTGLPSDDAVLDSVLEAGGADPGAVERATIGFEAVPALSAGRVDAATAFWNAEGVALRRLGVATHEFRVDSFGAPRYPELVLATSRNMLESDPGLVASVADASTRGYAAVVADPGRGLDALIDAVPGLERPEQQAQLEALLSAHALNGRGGFDAGALRAWARWDVEHGIVANRPDLKTAFPLDFTHD